MKFIFATQFSYTLRIFILIKFYFYCEVQVGSDKTEIQSFFCHLQNSVEN